LPGWERENVLTSYAVGLAAMVMLCVAWAGVQLAWRRVFPDDSDDPDALAGRIGCHGCGCTNVCERRAPESGGVTEEEMA